MDLQDAIALITHKEITEKPDAQWADLGCGSGFFTYALANHLQKGSSIHAVDKSPVRLQKLPNPHNINIYTKQLDFVHHPLPFNQLDGIMLANSLHYVSNKMHFITIAGQHLSGDGVFLVVEYDTDTANPWVPHPVSCHSLQSLFAKAGYASFSKLGEIRSSFNTGNIYAAIIKK
jgi:ubiquinone/menaquinone biosynthesis C-methylase UbiE